MSHTPSQFEENQFMVYRLAARLDACVRHLPNQDLHPKQYARFVEKIRKEMKPVKVFIKDVKYKIPLNLLGWAKVDKLARLQGQVPILSRVTWDNSMARASRRGNLNECPATLQDLPVGARVIDSDQQWWLHVESEDENMADDYAEQQSRDNEQSKRVRELKGKARALPEDVTASPGIIVDNKLKGNKQSPASKLSYSPAPILVLESSEDEIQILEHRRPSKPLHLPTPIIISSDNEIEEIEHTDHEVDDGWTDAMVPCAGCRQNNTLRCQVLFRQRSVCAPCWQRRRKCSFVPYGEDEDGHFRKLPYQLAFHRLIQWQKELQFMVADGITDLPDGPEPMSFEEAERRWGLKRRVRQRSSRSRSRMSTADPSDTEVKRNEQRSRSRTRGGGNASRRRSQHSRSHSRRSQSTTPLRAIAKEHRGRSRPRRTEVSSDKARSTVCQTSGPSRTKRKRSPSTDSDLLYTANRGRSSSAAPARSHLQPAAATKKGNGLAKPPRMPQGTPSLRPIIATTKTAGPSRDPSIAGPSRLAEEDSAPTAIPHSDLTSTLNQLTHLLEELLESVRSGQIVM